MDSAEYLPWCEKISESKKLIAELKDSIDDMKAEMAGNAEAEAAACETAGEEDAAGDAPVVIELSGDDEPKEE